MNGDILFSSKYSCKFWSALMQKPLCWEDVHHIYMLKQCGRFILVCCQQQARWPSECLSQKDQWITGITFSLKIRQVIQISSFDISLLNAANVLADMSKILACTGQRKSDPTKDLINSLEVTTSPPKMRLFQPFVVHTSRLFKIKWCSKVKVLVDNVLTNKDCSSAAPNRFVKMFF